jgi:hypothetical protein
VSRTHRSHLAPSKAAKRGGKQPDRYEKPLRKTHKQKRTNERAKIRKDYL